ncbi:MAG: DUF1343 domain-containing protein [Verrucomicrobiota bacterium]|nr:DUF1343 domain-containing protein [Verrucomicrobiota bacterium]
MNFYHKYLITSILCIIFLFSTGCETGSRPTSRFPHTPVPPALISSNLPALDQALEQAVIENKAPGFLLWLERNSQTYITVKGNRAILPHVEPMTRDTIFDAASLTKVIATTPTILLLIERGKLSLDDPVSRHWPEFAPGKESITIRHLLTHTSGLRAGLPVRTNEGLAAFVKRLEAEKPQTVPGSDFLYSDLNFIALGELVHRVSGEPLDRFATRELFQKLGMADTFFIPLEKGSSTLSTGIISRIAPTERLPDQQVLRGIVHDPTARAIGGVAGHAGLFTTAADLARFARMLLNDGELEGVTLFKPETVRLMTTVQTPPSVEARRGLGWDIDSPYATPRGKFFPIGSYGHTGWTGSSLWIDPFSRTFIILLSNRNHPSGGDVVELRSTIATLAAKAVADFDFSNVHGVLPPLAKQNERQVLNGIDVLKQEKFKSLRGFKIGLITNHTGRDRERNLTIDLLHHAEGVELKALFGPEHGIRGTLDEKVGDSVDQTTGLPVYSLYGERRSPTPQQLAGLDALLFDIQDIGCRFYTYLSTMGNCMEAASRAGLRFIVLDRVNPINAVSVEGPVRQGESRFTAYHDIPLRHGMTAGELARMFKEERKLSLDLTVVQIRNWKRSQYFDETGLPWINPSPNMRNLTQAILYPGIGLLEFSTLSVGRGTDTPFEIIGAPYINGLQLAEELNRAGLPGVSFLPVQFMPKSSVYQGTNCHGVNILLLDRNQYQPVLAGLEIARTLHRLYGEKFTLHRLDTLLQHPETIEGIRAGKTLQELQQEWTEELTRFKSRRARFLIYN